MSEKHDPLLIMLLEALATTCYDPPGCLCHGHNRALVKIFHDLEKRGILIREYPNMDWSYRIADPYKQYCWFYQ